MTDEDGRYRVQDVPAGRHALSLPRGYRPGLLIWKIKPGDEPVRQVPELVVERR